MNFRMIEILENHDVCMSVRPSVRPSVCLSVRPSVCMSVCLSTYLSHHPSIHPTIHPPIHPSIYPSIHPPIHPSIYLSVYLSVCLSITGQKSRNFFCRTMPHFKELVQCLTVFSSQEHKFVFLSCIYILQKLICSLSYVSNTILQS